MTCERFHEVLTALSLGELEPDEAAVARNHVAECPGCATAALRDRELVGMLQDATISAPPALRQSVVAAVRAEAARTQVAPTQVAPTQVAPSARTRSETRMRRVRSDSRRRRWLLAGAAVGIAAAIVAAVLVFLPRQAQPISPTKMLAAAWHLYDSEQPIQLGPVTEATSTALEATLGQGARSPDLAADGFTKTASGARTLNGQLTAVTEYRGPTGERLTVMRWSGDQPASSVWSAQHGSTASFWFSRNGVVYCLIGTVPHDQLYQVTQTLAHTV